MIYNRDYITENGRRYYHKAVSPYDYRYDIIRRNGKSYVAPKAGIGSLYIIFNILQIARDLIFFFDRRRREKETIKMQTREKVEETEVKVEEETETEAEGEE